MADALRVPWPETDAIVGNPPFHGSQLIRAARGDAYIDWLTRAFGVGVVLLDDRIRVRRLPLGADVAE